MGMLAKDQVATASRRIVWIMIQLLARFPVLSYMSRFYSRDINYA